MDKNDFLPRKLEDAAFVFEFDPVQGIEKKAIKCEEVIKSKFSEGLKLTNFNGPDQLNRPRFILQHGNEVFCEVSQVNAIIQFKYEIYQFDRAINQICKYVNRVFEYLSQIGVEFFNGLVLVLVVNFPLKALDKNLNQRFIQKYFSELIPIDSYDLSFKFSRSLSQCVVEQGISLYEMREKTFKPSDVGNGKRDKFTIGDSVVFRFKTDELDLKEKGISCKLSIKDSDIPKGEDMKKRVATVLNSLRNLIDNDVEQLIFRSTHG